jgi:stage II sporulation protein D
VELRAARAEICKRLSTPLGRSLVGAGLFAALGLSCPSTAALAAPTKIASTVRVALGTDLESCRLSCAAGLVFRQDGGTPLALPPAVTVRATENGLLVGESAYEATTLAVCPADGCSPITVDSHTYRGQISLSRGPSGRVQVVNVVDIDAYIMGVLAGEVSASWPEETLKAQAVAARSYALSRMQAKREASWDVVATDRDQVYDGVLGEVPAIARAVAATRGEVLTYQGRVIKAYFSSSCGGHTEDARIVFGETDAPYLKGVADPYCKQSPYQQWSRVYTVAELRRLLASGGVTTGTLTSLQAVARTPSGRIESVQIKHADGSAVLSGTDLRRLLGYRELRSTLCDLQVTRSVPYRYTTVSVGWKKVEKVQQSVIPEEVEIGAEECNPVTAVLPPESPFYVVGGRGELEKARAGYAYAASSEGVLRTFAMRPGLLAMGLEREWVTTKITLQHKNRTVTTTKVRDKKVIAHEMQLPVEFRFTGHGWGHGVGLCQWGARAMAVQGSDYRQILTHYYPGASIDVVGR